MEIRIVENKEELNEVFTEWMQEILAQKESLTLCLSGGSTPKSLFQYWAKNCKECIDWKKIKLFWGDERCVPPTDDESNYKMTKDNLLDFVPIPSQNVFRIKGENNPKREAQSYAETLQREVETNKGVPQFDILMLGMGDDGHTASIFPHEMDLWDSKYDCVVATHPVSGQKRVSISGKVINAAHHVAVLVTGKSKSEKLSEIVRSPQETAEKYPAARIEPESGNLIWFVDRDAWPLDVSCSRSIFKV